MSNSAYAVTSLAALAPVPVTDETDDGNEWRAVRHALDVRAFGVNVFGNRDAGGAAIVEHDEREDSEHGTDGHEELYVVLRGHAVFTIGGETVDAPSGTMVLVRDPNVLRSAVGKEADTQVLCVGGPVGRAYHVAEWEKRALADG